MMASRRSALSVARRGATYVVSSSSSRLHSGAPPPPPSSSAFSGAAFGSGCGNGEFSLQRSFSSHSQMRLYVRLGDFPTRPTSQIRSVMVLKNHTGAQTSGFHASSGNLVQEIGMPSLSPTMTQGNIAKWHKKEGDAVSAGDVLCEIETDKATLEMESMEEGFLAKILVPDGAKDIPVGEAICLMVESKDEIKSIGDYKPSAGGGGEAPKEAPPPPRKEASVQQPPPPPSEAAAPKPSPAPVQSSAGGDRIFATPAAKRLAEEKHVSLSSVKGTGPDGSVVKADIEEYLASGSPPSKGPTAPEGQKPAARGAAAGPLADVDYSDIPNTQIRRVTAKRLLLSKQTIPHYYLSLDTHVDKLLKLRAELNAVLESSKTKDAPPKKISLNDFVIKAAALALRKVPECNSSWTDDFIRQYHNVNVSVAVQTEHGLMVPVVKDADKKGLATISDDVKLLAGKARSNTLKPQDYEGGTFTVSNLGGPFGIKQFCAIINPPQACILAVGTTEKRVIPGDGAGEFLPGTFMTVTLSCDHRVVDGAIGAQWLGAFKSYIEDPVTLML
jgi:pyruvate dehydrogenase E2 component (dihydrolipoamide acetyltransferase)